MEDKDNSSACEVDYVGIWHGALWYAAKRLFFMWLFGFALQYLAQLSFLRFAWIPLSWLTEKPSLQRECHRLILGVPFDLMAAAICVLLRAYENHHLRKLRKALLPQNLCEFETAGVQTPIDFCYLALTTSFVSRKNIADGTWKPAVPMYNSDVFTKQLSCFKSMFGRNPMRAESADWLTITVSEMFFLNRRISGDLTYKDFITAVSPSVINYSTGNVPSEWLDILEADFPTKTMEMSELFSDRGDNNG